MSLVWLWTRGIGLLGLAAALGVAACTAGTPRQGVVVRERTPVTLAPAPNGVDAPVVGPVQAASAPRVAYDGQNFLVVWADDRGALRDVFAARVTPDGTLLDEENLALAPSMNDRDKPAVAFDGTHYLVVWQDSSGSDDHVSGALIEPDGTVGMPFPIPTKSVLSNCHDPAVAFDGTNFVVAWVQDSSRNAIEGVRVSSAGAVLDTTPKLLVQASVSGGTMSPPALTSDAAGLALAWTTGNNAYVGRLAADLGSVSVTSPALGAASLYDGVSLTSTGDELWLAWYDPTAGDQKGVRLERVDAATLAPVTASVLAASATDKYTTYPALGPLGSDVALVCSRQEDTDDFRELLTRFDTSGTVKGSALAELLGPPASAQHAALAAGDADDLLVWNELRHGGSTVYGARLDAQAGTVAGTGTPIALGLNKETEPQVAASDSGFLLAWFDNRGGGAQIYGTTIDAQGAVVHATASAIADDGIRRSEFRVASDGDHYLVAWRETAGGRTVGQLVDAAGSALGDPIVIADADLINLRVAFTGGVYLVAANALVSSSWNVVGVRVSPTGDVLDATPVLYADDGFEPRLVAGASEFLSFWREGDATMGVRVSATDGKPIDTTPVSLLPAGASASYYPEAAFGGGSYLIAWDDSGSPATIGAARLDQDLNLIDTTQLTVAEQVTQSSGNGTVPSFPNVAFDGTRFSVVYTNFVLTGGDISYETWLGAVQTDGTVITPVKVLANDDSISFIDARPIAGANGRTLVGYTLYDRPAGYDLDRVRYRTYSSTRSTLGGGCAVNGDCAAGTCVDGVCCASACAGGALDCQACSVISGSTSNGSCEPLPDGAACGKRGACDSGGCVEAPDPGAGGSAGKGGSGGTGGSSASAGSGNAAGKPSGGRASGGTTSAGGTGGDVGAGGEATGTGGDVAAGGTTGGSAGRAGRGGSAGAAPAGGASGARAGSGGKSSGSADEGPKHSSGCGCRVAQGDRPHALLGVMLLGCVAGIRRGRRRDRHAIGATD